MAFVKTDWANYGGFHVAQLHKLNYGNYLNSKGQTDNVVVSVEQRTEAIEKILEQAIVTREYAPSQEYEDLDQELEDLINKNS